MRRSAIARFVGSWISSSGHRLRIKKVAKAKALVDFFDPSGTPVHRPYMSGASSVQMVAHYDDYNGFFEVELWEEGKGFILNLTHEYQYELDPKRREALVPAISRYERDGFLDEFYSLFGSFDHFVRAATQNKSLQRKRRAVCRPDVIPESRVTIDRAASLSSDRSAAIP